MTLVEPCEWCDYGGYGTTAKRLIHRPERIPCVAYAKNDEPIKGDPILPGRRGIKIIERIEQDAVFIRVPNAGAGFAKPVPVAP